MKCSKCNGSGTIDNPRYWGGRYSCIEAWERGYNPTIKCKKCDGSGYIIGCIDDIVDRLKVAANGVAITQKEANEMLEAILK